MIIRSVNIDSVSLEEWDSHSQTVSLNVSPASQRGLASPVEVYVSDVEQLNQLKRTLSNFNWVESFIKPVQNSIWSLASLESI